MEGCLCCEIAQGGGKGYQKIVVELEGGWVLNHFGISNETYLGRLVLQTEEHRTDFDELSENEESTLGSNIKRINSHLRQYWSKTFPDDPIELVHVAYLNETPFIHRSSGEKLRRELHVHLHLLPRTKQMGETLDYCGKKIGWHLVDHVDKFPPRYKIPSLHGERVKTLMQYLKESLEDG